ncbi:multidrug effflux MFS transporter [Sphingomonas jatrophae]|uniref:Bcr/CflA family efflux transporter n=1 Tax=Sphingomonas jatrophae TaxID=1166337 RepID=A0A1I6K795_9SPHN|nr:multidrug effflux MFS transporter [Sphingomonas jatrophae]SFR87077.1 MFS transporter, DHA1 family, bicyclomycin/chloramphenicol resistance protein [Sphingomonas jatrophae]
MHETSSSDRTPERPGFKEFVGLVAGLMAINALGIDIMLPALPSMAQALGITVENQRQFIISAYVIGFGSMQIVYGPLADRFGRRPVLFLSLSLFVATSLLATFASSFPQIIAARLVQGMGAAATRVLAVSIVRDRYAGRQMARVMSLAFIVFLAVPILAPSIGQFILLAGPWRWIFYFLAAFGATLVLWAALRLPETLSPELRRPLDPGTIVRGFGQVLRDRTSRGYMLAMALSFACLMGFINSVQQIFEHVLHRPEIFAYVFAGCAGAMGVGSLLNARLVGRWGTRRVSQSALIGMITLSCLHYIYAVTMGESLSSFVVFQASTMFFFSMTGSNFGAMAMESMGAIAGTAASVQGAVSTVLAALIGAAIGQSFDGSTKPMILGFVLCSTASFLCVLWTERGRLFRPHHPDPAAAQ